MSEHDKLIGQGVWCKDDLFGRHGWCLHGRIEAIEAEPGQPERLLYKKQDSWDWLYGILQQPEKYTISLERPADWRTSVAQIHEEIVLTKEAFDAAIDLIQNPPGPNGALKQAVSANQPKEQE